MVACPCKLLRLELAPVERSTEILSYYFEVVPVQCLCYSHALIVISALVLASLPTSLSVLVAISASDSSLNTRIWVSRLITVRSSIGRL